MTVCVSLFGDHTDALVARLSDLATRRRVAELRLDRLGPDVDLEALAAARGELTIVLACVPQDQGGTFTDTEEEWASLVLRAVERFAPRCVLDVPPGFARPAGLAPEVPVVWSWHEAHGVVDTDLGQVDEQLQGRAAPQDFRKIVAWADRHEDALRAVRLLQAPNQDGQLIAFAQGPGSRASRLWALALGSPWSYASWRGEATAPGQWAEHLLPEVIDWTQVPLMGVMGDPIEHSKSPELWNAADRADRVLARLADEEAGPVPSYLRLQHAHLDAFGASHGAANFRAFSVTAPLKEQALRVADEASDLARQVGASNFLRRTSSGNWRAEQTDGAGALDPLREAGLPDGAPILILGAGGAARAVAAAALDRGHPVWVAARRIEAAQSMLDSLHAMGAAGSSRAGALNSPHLLAQARGASQALGIIQATPLGSVDRPGDPLRDQAFDDACWVLDMVYHPPETALLARAREAGATTVRGHRMLHAQMLEQYRLLHGREAPSAALLLALEAALGLPSPPILLCGPRASGKSTLGRWLAEVLDWPFVDADEELERRSGRAISDWLPADPMGFRAAEAALLEELALLPGRVIALGGGVVETPTALELLAAHPRVLGLSISPEEQLARRQEADGRPGLTEMALADEIRVLHERRKPLYEKACYGRWLSVEGMKADCFHRLLQRLKLLL